MSHPRFSCTDIDLLKRLDADYTQGNYAFIVNDWVAITIHLCDDLEYFIECADAHRILIAVVKHKDLETAVCLAMKSYRNKSNLIRNAVDSMDDVINKLNNTEKQE